MKPDTSQDTSLTWLQMAQGPKHDVGNSRDLVKRCWSLRDKELYLNCEENNVKGPHA
jgi:hypothetical protein